MNFRPELAAKVMAGEKTVTRRLASQNPRSPWYINRIGLRVGKDYAVCPGRGKNAIGRVVVKRVARGWLGHLTPDQARAEGFDSPASFEAAFSAINGSYEPSALVWVVEFERLVSDPA